MNKPTNARTRTFCPDGHARHALTTLAVSCVLVACLALAGCNGLGAAAKSVWNRVLPLPMETLYAATPQPDSYADAYADATGAGTNYVYDLLAADADGRTRTVETIVFGRKASGAGYLEITAKGDAGIRYNQVDEKSVPADALAALNMGA